MDEHDERNAQRRIEQRSRGEIDESAQRDFAIHFGIEASRAGNQAGDNQWQYHQLQHTHEQLAWVRDQHNGVLVQLQRTQRKALGAKKINENKVF